MRPRAPSPVNRARDVELERHRGEIRELLAKGVTFYGVLCRLSLEVGMARFAQWVRSEVVGSPVPPGCVAPEACGDPADVEIGQLGLSVRSDNVFVREGITRLGELVKLSAQELLRFEGLGQVSLAEIETMLWRFGLALREEGELNGESASRGIELPPPSPPYITVIEAPGRLAEAVCACIEEGYRPLGAPAAIGDRLVQAMTYRTRG